jgi:purine-binding chemotaxis protein CheW
MHSACIFGSSGQIGVNVRLPLWNFRLPATGFWRFPFPETVFPGTPQLTTASPAGLSDSMTRSRTSAQFVGFRLAEQDYAFRIEQIQEIVIPDRLTQLPQVPDYIEGVSNLRGTIIPVVSLRRLLNLPAVPRDAETRTIVVNVQPRIIGCTVDSVTQVLRIAPGEILPAPDMLTGERGCFIDGFAKVDSRLVTLLNVPQLLDPAKMEQVRELARSGVLATGP